jgi:DNA-binding NarL/FixJ family response regulator
MCIDVRVGQGGVMSTAALPTVVIADDDGSVRDALSALITAHPGLSLVGAGANGYEAAELCERHRPAVAIVDVMMPGGGQPAITAIREVSPRTSVIVYTARSDRRTRERMIDAGASLVVVKGGGVDLAPEVERLALRALSLELDAGPTGV